jgi:uncharacterized protein YndB with AHSA1/START domain
VAASQSQVYAAWTEPQLLTKWFVIFGYAAVSAQLEGRQYVIKLSNGSNVAYLVGTYREVCAPQLLSFSLYWYKQWPQPPSNMDTLVTIEFKESAVATEIFLTHELLATDDVIQRWAVEWGACLNRFARFAEMFERL